MAREKPCSQCGHTAMMHHFIKGTRAGSCAQHNCTCKSYQFNEAEQSKSVTMSAEEKARLAKLEAIERQLSHLIGQVRSLKSSFSAN